LHRNLLLYREAIESFSPGLVASGDYPGNLRPSDRNPERVESQPSRFHSECMSQSLAKVLIHTVFSTKERQPYFGDIALREELHRYLGGILSNVNCQPIIVGGVADHVHLLSVLSRTCEIAEMVKEVKRGSS
jgi:CO dehydrogenase/acetyl-CoA synthase delta subunit